MRILVAEDNESHWKLTKLILTRLGYNSDIATNGLEAVEAVKQCHYDLVLMDIVMPGIDGLQAAREIRKLRKNRVKIIGITAYVVPGIREMCLDAGMDECISKPVRIKDMAEVLKKYALDIQSSETSESGRSHSPCTHP